jgi:FAD/FMN-containing dehydrogenase
MNTLKITTLTGGRVPLDAAALEQFRAKFRGAVLTAGDDGYESARQVWNAMIDRRPAMIARCAGVADVIQAVNLARERHLLVSVRGGGHNVAGNAVNEGGLVIDLSPMKSVRVDPRRRTARVEPGCLFGELDRGTQAFGLAVPGGIVSTTGVAGLTLGGGMGWLSRKYGLTIDNLISAEVVTAAGELVTASDTENADLFWGIRGGGGNFGVVTSFEFRLHEVGPGIYSGLIVQPLDDAERCLLFYREFVAQAPDELTVWVVLRKAPPLPFLPAHVVGEMVLVFAFAYLGEAAEGKRLIRPLRRFGRPHGEAVGMHPFVAWQSLFDAFGSAGARNYWKSHYLSGMSDRAIATILAYAAELPSPQSEVFIAHLQGATSHIPMNATAYAHRGAPFAINIHGRWGVARDDAPVMMWTRQFFRAMQHDSTGGVYVNFMTEEGEDRVRAAYHPEIWERLARLKRQYDPINLFRLNQNIKPEAAAREARAPARVKSAA